MIQRPPAWRWKAAACRMRPISAIFLALVIASCGSEPAAPLPPPLPRLGTYTVQAGTDANGRSWDGVVQAVQQATLTAQTTGRVAGVGVDVNDRVTLGQVLLRLTAVEQQAGANTARAQLRAAEAAAAEAEASYRRYAALAAGQYVSRAQVDLARAARDSTAAARDAARAQLAQAGQQAEYTVIRAPFAGIVSARRVEPGESVTQGQSLMSVYAPGALRIEVQVPQSEAEAIRATNRARVVLEEGRSIDVAGVTVFPSADPATHSVAVRIALPDMPLAPRPGVTARVVFPISPAGAAPALRIPAQALVQRGEVSGVYVLEANRIALRQVRVGRRDAEEVEIIAGIKPGEKIATDPVAAVQALTAQRKAVALAGHE